MARPVAAKFEMFYSVDFETVIRGHHRLHGFDYSPR